MAWVSSCCPARAPSRPGRRLRPALGNRRAAPARARARTRHRWGSESLRRGRDCLTSVGSVSRSCVTPAVSLRKHSGGRVSALLPPLLPPAPAQAAQPRVARSGPQAAARKATATHLATTSRSCLNTHGLTVSFLYGQLRHAYSNTWFTLSSCPPSLVSAPVSGAGAGADEPWGRAGCCCRKSAPRQMALLGRAARETDHSPQNSIEAIRERLGAGEVRWAGGCVQRRAGAGRER